MKIKWKKVIPITLGLIILLFGGLLLYLRHQLDASLPQLEGEIPSRGLTDDVKVIRDARGIVRLEARSVEDLFFAQGFVHAQDRLFQMDLLRRFPGGELSEILGARTLEIDREKRALGRREVASAMLEAMPEKERRYFERYAEGVNRGRESLEENPPEYLVLRAEPTPWSAEDCLMVGMYFFDALSFNTRYEINVGLLEAALPPEIVDFLTPDQMPSDVTLLGEDAPYVAAQIPGPETYEVKPRKAELADRDLVRTYDDLGLGSNNWAVTASRSKKNMAILASDPHLNLGMPGVWYRNELVWPDGEALGVTAPGVPGVIIGSNGKIAWGLTNGMADHDDLVIIDVDPEDDTRYRIPGGFEAFGHRSESIVVAGSDPETLDVKTTRWGPVVDTYHDGRPLVLCSTGLDAATHNFDLVQMMFRPSLDDAIELASTWYGPSQNVMIAGADGRIGWVLSGFLPERRGFDGKAPRSWADGSCGWTGPLAQEQRPKLVDPDQGFLYTANNRMVSLDRSRPISRIWVPSWRAQRIGELLRAQESFDESDFLAIQLDTRDAQYDRYRDLVLALFPDEVELRALEVAIRELKAWNGRADIDSRGLPLLKVFAERLREALIAPIVAPCAELSEDFVYNWPIVDEVVFQLMTQKPRHLLDPEALARQVFETLVLDFDRDQRLAVDLVWGKVMRPSIEHPLGKVPPLDRFLNLPVQPLPGDANAVRAQSFTFGASMRMVAAPADLDSAILQSPGGQSGHFRSPHYSDLHQAWVEGKPDEMRVGDPFATLILKADR